MGCSLCPLCKFKLDEQCALMKTPAHPMGLMLNLGPEAEIVLGPLLSFSCFIKLPSLIHIPCSLNFSPFIPKLLPFHAFLLPFVL